MENKQRIKSGAFVVFGFIIFIVTFSALTKDDSILGRKNTYYAYVDDIQGIMFGSNVSFSGLSVGNVSDIEYVPGKQQIKMTIKVGKKYEALITTNSLIKLKTQGALGDRFIYIEPGEAGGTIIPDEGVIPVDNQPGFLETIGEKLSDLEQFSITLKRIDKMIAEMDEGMNFKSLGKNLNSALVNFSQASKTIKNQAQVKPTLDKLNNTLDAINQKKGTLGQLIYDPSLHNKVMGFLGEESDDTYLKSLMRKSIQVKEQK